MRGRYDWVCGSDFCAQSGGAPSSAPAPPGTFAREGGRRPRPFNLADQHCRIRLYPSFSSHAHISIGTTMKPASSALVTYLAALRSQNDATLLMADCFTFTLQSGLILTYTNIDVPVTLDGTIFAANSVLVNGLKYRTSVGLDVNQQQITLSATPSASVGGAPFLVALRDGAFDGCLISRDRAFFSDSLGGTVIGSVNLFTGRLATVNEVGRTAPKSPSIPISFCRRVDAAQSLPADLRAHAR